MGDWKNSSSTDFKHNQISTAPLFGNIILPAALTLYEVLQCFTRLRGAIAHRFAVCLLRCGPEFETRQGQSINGAKMAMQLDCFATFISFSHLFFCRVANDAATLSQMICG